MLTQYEYVYVKYYDLNENEWTFSSKFLNNHNTIKG